MVNWRIVVLIAGRGPNAPGTVIQTDESGAYDLLYGRQVRRRVDHQRAYRAADGTTNHQAEWDLSRGLGLRSASTIARASPTSPP
jgi:hypothetical protein